MAVKKYHEKNVVVYAELQSGETPATLTATKALKAIEATQTSEFTIDEQEYLGDFTDRDKNISISDEIQTIETKVFGKVLGTLNPALTLAEVPLTVLMQNAGGFITINGTTGVVNISNSQASNDLASMEFRKQTINPTTANTEKVYRLEQGLSFVDLDITVGKRPMFTFTTQGNFVAVAKQPIIVPDYGTQVANEAPVLRASNLDHSTITNVEGTPVPIELCFSSIKTSNLFGYDLTRFIVSCEELYEQTPVTPEVTFTILESELEPTNFNPEDNIGKRFTYSNKWGLGAGKEFGIEFEELILKSVTDNVQSNFFFKDLVFDNVKSTDIDLT